MAGLCNAVTAALADPHHWIASAAPALGLTLDDVNSALSADPLIRAITALLETDGVWTGTATELQTVLETKAVPISPRPLKVSLSASTRPRWRSSESTWAIRSRAETVS